MGLTFFRSVKFGPLRFNFSTSGIGVSAGIRGLRIGSGPRGAYINAGSHGFRYRASLGSRAPGASARTQEPSLPVAAPSDVIGATVYETRDVMQLTDTTATELLNVLNAQAGHRSRWPWALVAGLVVIGFGFSRVAPNPPLWASYALGVALVLLSCAVGWVAWHDRLRKLTVLFYDLDSTTERAFESFNKVWQTIAGVRNLWAIPQTQRYADKKYHGGASTGIFRNATQLRFGAPENVRCNIAIPLLLANNTTTLAFYPDRLLVFRANQVGAVSYSALQARTSGTRFNEEQRVPSDTLVVGRTWRYVNKSGGPDRRFKNNPEIPVCSYSDLELSSESGFSAYFMASKPNTFDIVPKAIELLRVLERHSREEVTHRPAG